MRKSYTLRKAGTALLLATFACNAPAVAADDGVRMATTERTFVKDGRTLPTVGRAAATAGTARTANTLRKAAAWSDGTSDADILVEEHFDAFTAGSETEPDGTLLASFYGSPGMYIDDSLTEYDTWGGNNVYSAGGKIALVSPSQWTSSDLNTPLGDYSGDLTITFRMKALETSEVFVNVLRGGFSSSASIETKDGVDSKDYHLYTNNGWKEVTVKISNYSADPDGYVQVHSYGKIVIDDFKVTSSSNSFVAAPKVLDCTDFTETSFTANWEPTRIGYNYYLDLYKKVYTSDSDNTYDEGFETMEADGSNAPEEWTLVQNAEKKVMDGEGADGSRGLILVNGDTVVSPMNYSRYKEVSLWMKVYDPGPYNNYDVYAAQLSLEARTLNGWEEIATFVPDGLFDGHTIALTRYIGDSQYYGFRITVSDLPEGDYVVLDNVNIVSGRPARLEALEGDFPGYFYKSVKGGSYTFEDLDPEGDYFYTIKTHYIYQYSDPVMVHAFGLPAPTALEATDITEQAYTANWEQSAKATGYTVTNYNVTTLKADSADYVILDEDFSKVTADVTDYTDPQDPEELDNDLMLLDEYADNPGWTGYGNTLCQGMVGTSWSDSYYVATPELSLGNADEFKLYLKAYGYEGDIVVITVGGTLYAANLDDNGEVEATFVIPYSGDATRIYFSSYNGYCMAIDKVKVMQDVKAGSQIYTYLGAATVDSSTLSYTFDGLSGYSCRDFAFNVVANLDGDGESTTSDASALMAVRLPGGPLAGVTKIAGVMSEPATETARYAIDGRRVSPDAKGICIVKMSDGSVKKVVRL